MEFNGFVFFAQIVNFLILIAILKKFLYRPILDAIRKRELYIKKTVEDADRSKTEFERSRAKYEEKMESLERDKERLKTKMYQEVEVERKKKIEEVKKEVGVLREKVKLQIEGEKQIFLSEIVNSLYRKFSIFADKALRELSNETLQSQILDLFIEKIDKLPNDEIQKICKKLGDSEGKITLSTFNPIEDEDRAKFEEALRNREVKFTEVNYRTKPELLMGVEMNVDSYYLLWNLENYLNEFKAEVEAILNSKSF